MSRPEYAETDPTGQNTDLSRGARIRTADPRVPNAVRCQLRYTPRADFSIPLNFGPGIMIITFSLATVL